MELRGPERLACPKSPRCEREQVRCVGRGLPGHLFMTNKRCSAFRVYARLSAVGPFHVCLLCVYTYLKLVPSTWRTDVFLERQRCLSTYRRNNSYPRFLGILSMASIIRVASCASQLKTGLRCFDARVLALSTRCWLHCIASRCSSPAGPLSGCQMRTKAAHVSSYVVS